MTLQQAIGMRIREIRHQLNRPLSVIGDRCGLHITYLSKVENGTINVSVQNLSLVIHQGLQVNLATFFETEIFAPINITHTETYERNNLKARKRPGTDSVGCLFPIHGSAVPIADPGIKKRSKQSSRK